MNSEISEAFVTENGSDLEKARLQYILYGSIPELEVLESFTGLQNDDGGFPCGLVDHNPSSLDRTHLSLWWLEELGRLESPEVCGGMDYIIRKQSGDGSWACEDGDVHAVDSTIESLRALKSFGLLPKSIPER